MELFLVDAIGPFFRDPPAGRLNWSKIPFALFQPGDRLDAERLAAVEPDFDTFCARVAAIGFNAVSLDDVARLCDDLRYPPALRELIAAYRKAYRRFFAIAQHHGLRIYLTTDLMFFPRDAGDALRQVMASPDFLATGLAGLFAEFPEVAGVIARVGESDGRDVRDVFLSHLVIRTPAHGRHWVSTLLATCEQHHRDLVVRTWSVGAYRIGDLIWNRDTFRSVFAGLDSPRLIVSMKYGETDFFRYLPLNPQFERGAHRMMIELQTRREYEGCGEYPSFVGWDYQRYRDELADRGIALCGVTVWCQTGGWTPFRRLTYLAGSSVWNEINTHVTLRLFRDGLSTEAAIADWCRENGRAARIYDVTWLLRLSDEVVKEILYIEDFAGQKLFFRRLRVPPLLWIHWDQILVNRGVALLLDCFVRDGRRLVRGAERSLSKFDQMLVLAQRSDLPADDIAFQRDTFAIMVAARRYFFLPADPRAQVMLRNLVSAYKTRHRERAYDVRLDFRPLRLRRHVLSRLTRWLVRRQRGYRWMDRVVTLRLLAWLYPYLRCGTSIVPAEARERAMSIDVIFK